jgi:hypothetical protein
LSINQPPLVFKIDEIVSLNAFPSEKCEEHYQALPRLTAEKSCTFGGGANCGCNPAVRLERGSDISCMKFMQASNWFDYKVLKIPKSASLRCCSDMLANLYQRKIGQWASM